jgi:hypothetical protein
MPYILVCLPICAIFFSLIPVAATLKAGVLSIILMMTVIIFFNFTMSVWRSPVVSLMPDFTPSHLQSDANAVINIMGGIGQMIGFVVGTIATTLVGLLGFTAMQEALKEAAAELNRLRRDAAIAELTAELDAAPKLEGGASVVARLLDGDMNLAKDVASRLIKKPGIVALLGVKTGEDQAAFVFARSQDVDIHMGQLLSQVAKPLGGKGGGRGTLAQGSAPTPAGLNETVEQLRIYLRNVLKA